MTDVLHNAASHRLFALKEPSARGGEARPFEAFVRTMATHGATVAVGTLWFPCRVPSESSSAPKMAVVAATTRKLRPVWAKGPVTSQRQPLFAEATIRTCGTAGLGRDGCRQGNTGVGIWPRSLDQWIGTGLVVAIGATPRATAS